MRFYRTKLLILFIVVAAGATLYYFQNQGKLFSTSIENLEKNPLENITQQTKSINPKKINVDIGDAVQNAKKQFSTLSSRSIEVSKQAGNILDDSRVLGSSIEATGDNAPIYEKTFEYGKYVYCKSVVKDFEEFNNL